MTESARSESWRSMIRSILAAALGLSLSAIAAQPPAPRPSFDAFEVATVKPVDSDGKRGRYITMQGADHFLVRDYTLQGLVAAAYDLTLAAVSGGPAWTDTDHYDIVAVTPGHMLPTHDEQMSMLRDLLSDRFKLTFHRQPKEFSLFELQVARTGSKLRPSATDPQQPSQLIGQVFPDQIRMPGRNATMKEFAALLQRAILDRPVLDKTGLAGHYDFDLEWAPDDSQFGGAIKPPVNSPSTPFFTAIQEQLGLKLVATKGPVSALIIDKAEQPSAN
jgi:uncharacterized protein (TIGR03435 family)